MKIKCDSIINLLTAFIIICYAGPLSGYKGILLLITLFGFLQLLYFGIAGFKIKRRINCWKLLLLYLSLNSILNIPYSLNYLLVLYVGYLFILRKLDNNDYRQVFNSIKFVAIAETFTIIIQHYFVDIYYVFAKAWFFYSNQFQQVIYLWQNNKQLSGLFYEVSFAAFIVSFGIIMCFIDVFTTKKKKHFVFNMTIIILSYYAIILTGKRSFILIIPFILTSIFIIKSIQHITFEKMIIFSVGLLILILSQNYIYNKVSYTLSKGKVGTINLSSRELFWGIAFNMFKNKPITGEGLNSFDNNFNASEIRKIKYDFAGAHNSYIQILGETGIIGLIIYIIAIASTLLKGFRLVFFRNYTNKYLFYSIGLLLLILMYSLTGNTLYQPQQLITFFWMIATISWVSFSI